MSISVTPFSGRTKGGEFLIEWHPKLGFASELNNPVSLGGTRMRETVFRLRQKFPQCAFGTDSTEQQLWATSLTPKQAIAIHKAIESAYWAELAARAK